MKHGAMAISAIVFMLLVQTTTASQVLPLVSFFPELEGWRKTGHPKLFQPETLYEHINGAAENFLSFDFRQLAVLTYINDQKQSLSAEIYFQATPENAFGIYSSEKPLKGSYFSIGSQGYAEEGVLNFISDAYYIKLNSFDLGPEGKAVMISLAEKITQVIGGQNALPKILTAFPDNGKLAHSERFIRTNFLGHEFLHAAYLADYLIDGQRFQLFIIQTGSEVQARAMLEKYAALDKEKTWASIQPGAWVIQDPYNGVMQLYWQGKFICGSSSQKAAGHIATLARNLAAQQ